MPTPAQTAEELPPVTDAHRRTAFDKLGYARQGWTFHTALADDTRRRVIEALASRLRTADWAAVHRRTVMPVHRCRPGVDGHPGKWCTQLVAGPYVRVQPDLLSHGDDK